MEDKMKFIDKKRIEKRIKENNKQSTQKKIEIEKLQEVIETNYYKIGKLIVEKSIKIDNEEIIGFISLIQKSKTRLNELTKELEADEKDLFSLEEALRNMNGKVGCPNCGNVYDKNSELLFCPKCGTSLK